LFFQNTKNKRLTWKILALDPIAASSEILSQLGTFLSGFTPDCVAFLPFVGKAAASNEHAPSKSEKEAQKHFLQ